MDIRKLQRAIVDGLEDVKAQHIAVFNTEALSPLFERVIIASGTSNRQTKALAASVRDTVKSRGLPVLRTEGEEHGEWIIVDCGAAVAHIMQPTIRDYYRLEEIWGGKPVKLKRAEVSTALPKASEPAAPTGRVAASGTAKALTKGSRVPSSAAKSTASKRARPASGGKVGVAAAQRPARPAVSAPKPASAPKSAGARSAAAGVPTSAGSTTKSRAAAAKRAAPVAGKPGAALQAAPSKKSTASPRTASARKVTPRGKA